MCGLAGLISLSRPIDLRVLQRMTTLQAHRGPDGEGFVVAWEGAGDVQHAVHSHAVMRTGPGRTLLGLGHRRLAILDLSDRGRQPMGSPDRRRWVVFNGAVYNFRDLRAELVGSGHRFCSGTDTEVLLAAYSEWGDACLPRLEGMFAFAIWDADRRRLLCARDRLGIKPFYHASPPGAFAFASEIKALLTIPGIDDRPDDDAVLDFLVHGNCDYGRRTVLRSVEALAPGHALALDIDTGRVTTWPWWRLRPDAPDAQNGDRSRIAALRTLLTETTERHLISDVPVGSSLSGGLDSSTVVSLVGRLRRERPDATAGLGDALATFTACHHDPAVDERDYAQAVAAASGARAHLVFPDAGEFFGAFERMAWHQDMPFAEPTYYAQWCVMRAAHVAGIKVLLDGQGGDEVFGGYAKFRYAYLLSLLRAARLRPAARELATMLRHGDRYVLDLRNGYRYLPRPLRRLFGTDTLIRDALRADWSAVLAHDSTPAGRWWRYATNGTCASGATAVQRMQLDDIRTDTLPTLLRTEDRSSMAFSLEARVPLLDHRVVEYGVGLPDHLKIRNGWSKYAVREAMAGLMPEHVRMRRSKLGFAVPVRQWLMHDLRPQIRDLLAGSLRTERYVRPAVLRRWYARDPARTTKDGTLSLFRVLSLEMWMRAFAIS